MRAVLLDLDDTLTDRVATDLDAIAAELERIDQNGYNRKRADDIAAHAAWTDRPPHAS